MSACIIRDVNDVNVRMFEYCVVCFLIDSIAEAQLLAPPPGLPTITGLPEAQLVPSAPPGET